MDINKIKPLEVVCRQSSISCALACKRKWWCKYRMGITLRGEQMTEAADLGKIYHRLQQLGPGSEMTIKTEVSKQQQDLMERVNRGDDLDGQIQRKASMLTELYHKAVVMAQIFWEKYPQPSHFKTIGTEINYSMIWEGLTLEGTIDKLLRNEQDDSVWIRDHKSTSRSLDSIFGGIAWSIQARIYRILAGDYLEYISYRKPNPRGFILDGIVKPGIKLCKADEKNAKEWGISVEDAYLRRVKEWYAEKGEDNIRSRGILFTEPLFPAELKRALTKMRVLSLIDHDAVDCFDRDITRRECFAYEKQCIYHDLCSTDPKQWGQLFETKYKFSERGEKEDEKDDSGT